jgi:hypothetical protein
MKLILSQFKHRVSHRKVYNVGVNRCVHPKSGQPRVSAPTNKLHATLCWKYRGLIFHSISEM